LRTTVHAASFLKKSRASVAGNFTFHHFFCNNCFILVQTASSSVFVASYALPAGFFHKLFNTTVEIFYFEESAASLGWVRAAV